jgi:phosphoenolpyruvate---glycerone phosphotransferase subunit DhaL
MTFKNSDGLVVVADLIATIQKNKDFLSEVDGKIGDGDHGINMNKGFTLCGSRLEGKSYSMSEGLAILSKTLMGDIGGSMGPLYGVFFEELASVSSGKDSIDAGLFGRMLAAAQGAVMEIGSAKRGDKTLLDTLIPAVESYTRALAAGKDFSAALGDMRVAAESGWRSTEGMMAKVGRASRLGERSRGVLDAGATSCYLIIDSLARSIQGLIKAD